MVGFLQRAANDTEVTLYIVVRALGRFVAAATCAPALAFIVERGKLKHMLLALTLRNKQE